MTEKKYYLVYDCTKFKVIYITNLKLDFSTNPNYLIIPVDESIFQSWKAMIENE